MASRKKANERFVVGAVADIPPGSRQIVTVKGREIGVFNLDGAFFALLNYCPHRAGPLCRGRLRPLVVPTGVYGLDYEREGEILKCPWHQWEFDVRTGEALYDPSLRVRTYRVEQEDGQVVLYV